MIVSILLEELAGPCIAEDVQGVDQLQNLNVDLDGKLIQADRTAGTPRRGPGTCRPQVWCCWKRTTERHCTLTTAPSRWSRCRLTLSSESGLCFIFFRGLDSKSDRQCYCFNNCPRQLRAIDYLGSNEISFRKKIRVSSLNTILPCRKRICSKNINVERF